MQLIWLSLQATKAHPLHLAGWERLVGAGCELCFGKVSRLIWTPLPFDLITVHQGLIAVNLLLLK